ncbi:hypothetical protein ABTZ46_02825 [Nocardioides sp. NPDC126508]
MDATFVLAEHSLGLLESAVDSIGVVHSLIDLLEEAKMQGRVLAWEEVFAVPVGSSGTLSDFLFGPDANLEPDLKRLLGGLLDKLPKWGSEEGSPALEATVKGETFDWAPSVSVCLEHVGADPWALLCASEDISGGPSIVSRESEPASGELWLLVRAAELRGFWRDALLRYHCTESDLRDASPHAFPGTVFAPAAWSQCGSFQGAWADLRGRLIAALAGLDDGAAEVFGKELQSHERIRLMSAIHGVDCSPESPSTHKNSKAMAQREAVFEDKARVCEWHAKLERHRNRIHFLVDGSTVYVGVFADHLMV